MKDEKSHLERKTTIDLGAVTQAGRWKSNRMPMRYGEHTLAARGGIARAAKSQGRDRQEVSDSEGTVPAKLEPKFTVAALEAIVARCGGESTARQFAAPLLERIQVLESRGAYEHLLAPVRSARDQADLRGRLLEINLAYQLERAGITPVIAAKQSGAGDIDFKFEVGEYSLFIETKLLRQDDATALDIKNQIARTGRYSIARDDDRDDEFRLQRDLIQKANTKKFSPVPKDGWINLVAVDVSEIQLGAVDVFDCILAAAGNPQVAALAVDSITAGFLRRSDVIGVFESATSARTTAQKQWVDRLGQLVTWGKHPQSYIHGAIFLFRDPADTAALVYDLTSVVVWNRSLVSRELAGKIAPTLHQIAPFHKHDHG
jgi:hypothetical protein